MTKKYLDATGVAYLWTKIKDYVASTVPSGVAPKNHRSKNITYGDADDEYYGHVKTTHSMEGGGASDWDIAMTPYGVKLAFEQAGTVKDVTVFGRKSGSGADQEYSQVSSDGIARLSGPDFGVLGYVEAANTGTGPSSGQQFTVFESTGITLVDGGIILVKFGADVLVNAQLTIHVSDPVYTGLIPIYYNGSAITSGIIKANDIVVLMYDATNNRWHLISRVYTNFATNKAGLVPGPGSPGETGEWKMLTDGGWITIGPGGDPACIPWARLYSPTFTGAPKAPTPSASTDTTQIATTEFVHDVVDDAVPSDFTGTDGEDDGTSGLVPAPLTTDAGKYLKADGTWATPSGGGSGGIVYCTCTSSASTVEKVANIVSGSLESLETGCQVVVKFSNYNSASNPTLKVGDLEAVAMKKQSANAVGTTSNTSWDSLSVVTFTYDGTYWMQTDHLDNTIYDLMSETEMKEGTQTGYNRSINAKRLKDAVRYHAYPVGAVYETTSPTDNPNILFGTLWERIASTTQTAEFVTGVGDLLVDDNGNTIIMSDAPTYKWRRKVRL